MLNPLSSSQNPFSGPELVLYSSGAEETLICLWLDYCGWFCSHSMYVFEVRPQRFAVKVSTTRWKFCEGLTSPFSIWFILSDVSKYIFISESSIESEWSTWLRHSFPIKSSAPILQCSHILACTERFENQTVLHFRIPWGTIAPKSKGNGGDDIYTSSTTRHSLHKRLSRSALWGCSIALTMEWGFGVSEASRPWVSDVSGKLRYCSGRKVELTRKFGQENAVVTLEEKPQPVPQLGEYVKDLISFFFCSACCVYSFRDSSRAHLCDVGVLWDQLRTMVSRVLACSSTVVSS